MTALLAQRLQAKAAAGGPPAGRGPAPPLSGCGSRPCRRVEQQAPPLHRGPAAETRLPSPCLLL